MFYAAMTDHKITEEEREHITDNFDADVVKASEKEISNDNYAQRLDKISNYVQSTDLSQSDIDSLLEQMKEMYSADGKFDSVEKGTLMILSQILKA
tara:strand:+ start:972 stop:1259 length:288 start_codon:yes stop_codon:yes gene_type:complete